jgi:hypothetical protein
MTGTIPAAASTRSTRAFCSGVSRARSSRTSATAAARETPTVRAADAVAWALHRLGRDRDALTALFKRYGRDIAVVIHTAAQPSHDWAVRDHHHLDHHDGPDDHHPAALLSVATEGETPPTLRCRQG